MTRLAGVSGVIAILGLVSGGFAKSRPVEDPLDSTKGARLASRIPCDGATNPEELINLATTFSPGSWARSFRIDVFEDKYCKRGDLGFTCIQPGHTLWKKEWSVDSSSASTTGSTTGSYGLPSCVDWGSKDTPQIVLTGWYKEGGFDPKLPWKQAEVKKVTSRWETYEFTDPNGETARVEINRR